MKNTYLVVKQCTESQLELYLRYAENAGYTLCEPDINRTVTQTYAQFEMIFIDGGDYVSATNALDFMSNHEVADFKKYDFEPSILIDDSFEYEFNSCASLASGEKYLGAHVQYKKLLSEGIDPLMFMMNMQFDLQKNVTENRPDIPSPDQLNTIGEKYEWLRFNKTAFDDEFSEMVDALGGMSNPSSDRSAVWKKWKSKYSEMRSKTFDDFSGDELIELKFELADSFHFYMNMFFALDVSAEELFTLYYAKNAENHRRTKSGY